MSSYGIVPEDLDVRISPEDRAMLTGTGGVEDTAKTQADIDAAEVKFHGYSGVYYATPIAAAAGASAAEAAAVMALVKQRIVDVAAYLVASRKKEYVTAGNEAQFWKDLNNDTTSWLEGLSKASRPTRLPGAAERGTPMPTTGGAIMQSDESQFTRMSMRGFR